MLPNSNIAAPNWDEWQSGAVAADILKVHQANLAAYVTTYQIGKQKIAGRWVYNRYDCEAAAPKIAAKRAARAAAQSVTP